MQPSPSALLLLADGYTARGRLIGRPGTTTGKLVFNTGMTGYQETLTDPSYAGEIITFTFPLIGIYGATEQDSQSSRVHARGLVVSELNPGADNWRSEFALSDLLLRHSVTGIAGLDTRRLTRHLRDRGEMLGVITSELSEAEARGLLAAQPDFGQLDLVLEVSCKKSYVYEAGRRTRQLWPEHDGRGGGLFSASAAQPASAQRFTVAAWDFGIKQGILDCFAERGCSVHVFPATASAEELLAISPDGVFLSNGPGDPARMDYALPHVQRMLELARQGGPETGGRRLPVFGICLGHQLMARAAGIPTYRLKFGNRGANHPVLNLTQGENGRVHITSQNHSYAVALDAGDLGRPSAAPLQALDSAAALAAQSDPRGGRSPLGLERMAASDAAQWLKRNGRPACAYPHPLNADVLVTQLNVNDRSNEGLAWRGASGQPFADWPAFSVQYHPEGCPGPRDNTYLFDQFCELMAR